MQGTDKEDIKKGHRKKKILPILVIFIVSLFILSVTIPNIVVKATNQYYIYNNFTYESDLDDWTIASEGGTIVPYLTGDGHLYIPDSSGLYTKVESEVRVYEWKLWCEFAIDPTAEWDTGGGAYIFESASREFNENSVGYHCERAYVMKQTNNTWNMYFKDLYNAHSYTVYNLLPYQYYQFNFHMFNKTLPGGNIYGYGNLSMSHWNATSGVYDGFQWVFQDVKLNVLSLSSDQFINVGCYAKNVHSGALWFNWYYFFYDDGNTTPYIPPIDDPDNPDVYDDNDYISLIVYILLFFIPIAVLTFAIGRIGFISGMMIMTMIFTFSFSNFLYAGVINFIAIGVMLLRGGLK